MRHLRERCGHAHSAGQFCMVASLLLLNTMENEWLGSGEGSNGMHTIFLVSCAECGLKSGHFWTCEISLTEERVRPVSKHTQWEAASCVYLSTVSSPNTRKTQSQRGLAVDQTKHCSCWLSQLWCWVSHLVQRRTTSACCIHALSVITSWDRDRSIHTLNISLRFPLSFAANELQMVWSLPA